jgi:hypothetical protein
MQIANQMSQPGQMDRTFFRCGFGVGQGPFTLGNPVKNVVGGVWAGFNWEFGWLQWIIDVMPFGVVVLISTPANLVWPGAGAQEDKRGQTQARVVGGE